MSTVYNEQPDLGELDLEERHALRRVAGLSTELQDISEVEYRALRLERVVLIGVWAEGSLASAENSLRELSRLAETAGSEVLDALIQRRSHIDAATYVGSGKARELAGIVATAEADTVICDGELTPSQLRRLESVVQVKVIDRTALILDIFAQHARSREGKAQVELAQLQYMLPRLRGWGESLSRPAVAASAPAAPARRSWKRTGGGSGPAFPGCRRTSTVSQPAARCSEGGAAAARCRRSPSPGIPTRASPACSTR
jgi:GTP-binding protein HflX